MPMSEAEFLRQQGDAYRAIGRFVVKFSQLVHTMRFLTAQRLTMGHDPQPVGEVILAEAAAGIIANAFFGVCAMTCDLDDHERAVAKTLAKAVERAIGYRNKVAHGDWWVGHAEHNADEIKTPALVHLHALREKGYQQDLEVPVAELDKRSDEMVALANLVNEFGRLCFGLLLLTEGKTQNLLATSKGKLRVRDVLVMGGTKAASRVVREGPKANFVVRIAYTSP